MDLSHHEMDDGGLLEGGILHIEDQKSWWTLGILRLEEMNDHTCQTEEAISR